MDPLTKEFLIQLLSSLVRKALLILGTLLEGWGIVNHDQAAGFSSAEIALHLAGLILMGAPVVWSIIEKKWNIRFSDALHQADPNVPREVVKADLASD